MHPLGAGSPLVAVSTISRATNDPGSEPRFASRMTSAPKHLEVAPQRWPRLRESMIVALLALVLLLTAIAWVEWPSGNSPSRPSLSDVQEALVSRQYVEFASPASSNAAVLVARGARSDQLPALTLSSWKTWAEADRAVEVEADRTLPVGSCRLDSTPPRATCVVAERTTASVLGVRRPALTTLRRLAEWLRVGGISGAGYWDGRTH